MKYKKYALFTAAAVSLSLGSAAFGFSGAEDSSFRMNAATIRDSLEEAQDTAEEEISPEEAASQAGLSDLAFESRYRAGKYTAGEDIPEGEYMLFSYGEKSSVRIGIQFDNSYMVSADPVSGSRIKIFEKGGNITLDSCYAVPINLVRPEMLDLSGPGMYKAGMHIKAGNYTLVPDSEEEDAPKASYTIFNTLTPETEYQSGEVTSDVRIRLSDGQYILLQGCRFSTAPSPVMITFSDKETVRRVQGQLNMLHYDCGTPDGMPGQKTTAAITRYQEEHGLTANGKITSEFLLSLDTEIPYAEVEAEIGPFLANTADFVSRYSDAALRLSGTEPARFAAITADDIEKGDCRLNDNGSCAFETNRASDKILSAFYVLNGSYDRKSVLELSLLMYAADPSYPDLDSAVEAALRLLFDGSLKTDTLSAVMLNIEGSTAAWIQPLS